MKILFTIGQLTLGGSERRLLDLAEELKNRGVECRINNLSGDHMKDGKEFYVRKSKLKKLFDFMKDISEFKPDIIHSFDLQSSYYAKAACQLMRKKTPVIAGFGAAVLSKSVIKKLLNYKFLQPECYVANSIRGAQVLKDVVKSDKKVHFIPNGLNTARFIKDISDPPEWTKQKNIIGYIGKFDWAKHGERMVEIAKEFATLNIDAYFVVIGEGPYFQQSVNLVNSDSYLQNRMILTGNINNAAVLAKYFKMGVLCSDTEGLPNVILEYMALGVPSITTDVGECRNVLDNGNCGIIINEYDKFLFKESILKLLTNDTLYKTLSENSLKRFNEEYTIKKMTDNYTELYSEILKK